LRAAELTATRVLEELGRIAFSNVGDLLALNGLVLEVKALLPEVQATVASLEVAVVSHM
jgi:hypothetical protein